MEQLHFNVEGKFITDLARSWFWSENREYSVCEELLCNCLMSDEITEVEQKAYARDIIEGRKQLCGTSVDGLTLEDDGRNIRLIQDKLAEVQEQLRYKVFEDSAWNNFLPLVDPYSKVKARGGWTESEGIITYEQCYHYFAFSEQYRHEYSESMQLATKCGLWLIDYPEMVYGILTELYPHDLNITTGLVYRDKDLFWQKIYEETKDWDNEDFKVRNRNYLGSIRRKERLELVRELESEECRQELEEQCFNRENATELQRDQKAFLDKQLENMRTGKYGEKLKADWKSFQSEYELIIDKCPRELVPDTRDLEYVILDDDIVSPYGLVSPDGKWYSCDFGGHQVKAYHLLMAYANKLQDITYKATFDSALDDLISAGWVAVRFLYSIGNYVTIPSEIAGSTKQVTKAQKDTIWEASAKHDLNLLRTEQRKIL